MKLTEGSKLGGMCHFDNKKKNDFPPPPPPPPLPSKRLDKCMVYSEHIDSNYTIILKKTLFNKMLRIEPLSLDDLVLINKAIDKFLKKRL